MISINGKFDTVIAHTNNSKNFKFAIDLPTPTIQGGQYIPINYDVDENNFFTGFGASGYHQAGNDNRDINYLQSIYYGMGGEFSISPIPIPIPFMDKFFIDELKYPDNLMPKIKNPNKNQISNEDIPLNQLINKPIYNSS
jgi:hypothetical protein